MLSTKDIGGVADLTQTGWAPTAADSAVVALAYHGQVLGGATVAGTGLVDCWAVSDLVVDHWARLLPTGQVTLAAIDPGQLIALRNTLDRFSALGEQLIQAETDRRQGTLDAVGAIVASLKQE